MSSDLSYNFVFDSSFNVANTQDPQFYKLDNISQLNQYFTSLLASKPEFSGSQITINNSGTFDITLVVQLALTENNYQVEFKESTVDTQVPVEFNSTNWKNILELNDASYNMSNLNGQNSQNYYTITGNTISNTKLTLTNNNNKIYIYPESSNVNSYHTSYGLHNSSFDDYNQSNGITLALPTGSYTRSQLINSINSLLATTLSPNGDAIALNSNIIRNK